MTLYELGQSMFLIAIAVTAYGAAHGLGVLVGRAIRRRMQRDRDVLGEMPTRRW